MWVEQMAEIGLGIRIRESTEKPVVCKKYRVIKTGGNFWKECLSMSDTDRVVLGRRGAVDVHWNKLQHQQASPW